MLVQCAFCAAMPDLTSFGDVIYDDDRCSVLLHPDSSVAGHAMVIWKRHVENLSELDAAELAHYTAVHTRAERALLHETKRERAIVMKLGIQTPHLHVHIYPVAAGATRDDVMKAIEGVSREQRPSGFVDRLRLALTVTSA